MEEKKSIIIKKRKNKTGKKEKNGKN